MLVNMQMHRYKNKAEEMQTVVMQSEMRSPHGSHGLPKGKVVTAQVHSPLPLAV